jgi:hypothetical protein
MGSFFKSTLLAIVTTLAVAGGATAWIVACSSDPAPTQNVAVGRCTTVPGEIPKPDCDDSTNECGGGGCPINEARCGTASTCLPLSNNKGKDVWDLRLRKLKVVSPPGLAEKFIQDVVVGRNIDLNASECGDRGTGSFSWLIRVDTKARTLITGGAPPSADPFDLGYCFANDSTNGVAFGPSTVGITIEGNKITPTGNFPKLNIPIYVDGDPNNILLLPISNGNFRDLTISEDGNCIGSFNTMGMNATCDELRGTCAKWKTAGSVVGFITLEEADKVILKDLENRTLCGYLTGNTTSKGCKREGSVITAKGDYCSVTSSAGGCGDSYWLAATFAASAVKIHDGRSIKQCSGGGEGPSGSTTDAGRD